MSRTTHRIHRQRWLVKAPSQEEAFAIRLHLRSQLGTALLPVFERAFDALGAGEDVVRIPRLALDLKLRPGEDFIAELTDTLRERLGEVLQEAAIAPPELAGAYWLTARASRRQLLLNYLATGHVEWHDNSGNAENLSRVLLAEACAFASEKETILEALSGPLAQRIAASFRLLQLLPYEARLTLLALAPLHTLAPLPERLPATADAAVALLPIILQRLTVPGMLDSYLLLRIQALLLAMRREDIRHPLETPILTLLQECLGQVSAHTSATTSLSAPHESSHGQAALLDPAAILCTSLHMLTGSATEAAHKEPASPSRSMPDIIASSLAASVMRPSGDIARKSGYPACDAGLVLLHPFLSRLFNAVGIAPLGTHELPATVLPRAAAMLHWLISGREEVYEFELTVIKVLLGLAPDHVLPVDAGLLGEADRNEADAMLAAAIAHWGALGKTGVAALRMSFLQRRGLLRDIGSGWQLQVESESFDLLLGKLPWGISIVRLPWMTKPIFIEWPTP